MTTPYTSPNSLHVKTESSPSPDLIPPVFPPSTSRQNAYLPVNNAATTPGAPVFRFGLDAQNDQYASMPWQSADINAPDMSLTSMSYMDEFDDGSDLVEMSSAAAGSSNDAAAMSEKQIRRRSSKACDQCRKSKCKCERTNTGDPCRNCVLLSTPCTFLGPSKKRGPPKGYIDAIEARLHQSEALLGVLLASEDSRATTLFRDLAQDSLANDIIRRVDASSYGVNGRKQSAEKNQNKHPKTAETDFTAVHPSNEWQDQVLRMLRKTTAPASYPTAKEAVALSSSADQIDSDSSTRRQRRRLDGTTQRPTNQDSTASTPTLVSPIELSRLSSPNSSYLGNTGVSQNNSVCDSDSDEESVRQAVGQLSLNEDEEVRYHGKASGLYLLGAQDRRDNRNVGGLWRFPQARVWPPLPNSPPNAHKSTDDFSTIRLPPLVVQQRLLDAYFTYVHTYLPLVHKQNFLELFNAAASNSSDSPDIEPYSEQSSATFQRKRRRIPTILLLAMFSVAARYVEEPPVRAEGDGMWDAGDDFLYAANKLLSKCYAQSRPSTCQALLVLGYREVGIGAMAHAWTYIGMAVRMAQDLGLHRSAEGWIRGDMGGQLFEQNELNERRRIWYACVVMDKYVSNYIGRPLSISERDFDTLLPPDDDPEEFESSSALTRNGAAQQRPSRMMSCFNCSAKLAGIISMIIQAVYAVRPAGSRHDETRMLESVLEKWYLELPPHLRHESSSQDHSPSLPHVLVLHMTYWCSVLLLHRPFIQPKQRLSDNGEDHEKHYSLCTNAANRITSIASTYKDTYGMAKSSVFPCYYVFTAGVMHTWTLSIHPNDAQARLGIAKCMEVLYDMEVLWPSASRQLELLRGAKSNAGQDTIAMPPSSRDDQRKRTAAQAFTARSLHDVAPMYPRDPAGQSASQHFYHPPSSFGMNRPLSMSQTQPQPIYYPSVDRWQQMDPGTSLPAMPFLGSNLTTSAVLPQMYSTGMEDDDRAAIMSHRISRSASHPQLNNPYTSAGRYQTYWNEHEFPPFDNVDFGLENPPTSPGPSSQSQSQYYGNRYPM